MSIKNTLTFYLVSSILSILFINTKNYVFLILFLLLVIFAFIKIKFVNTIIMIVFFSFFLTYRVNNQIELKEEVISIECKVVEAKESYLIVKANNVYYYVENVINPIENDTLSIYGKVEELSNDLDLYMFEFKDYLNKKRIYYKINPYKIEIINRNEKLSSKIVTFLTSKLEGETYIMVKMLLFNDKKADGDVYDNLLNINALHLFVVSGFHISFLWKLILFFFKKHQKAGNIVAMLICSFYVYLLGFSISASRALVCSILSWIFKDKLSKQDMISIVGILFLIIEPMNIYNYSYIMTYIVSFTLAFSSSFTYKIGKVGSSLITSFVCLLSLLPIQLQMNYKINFISFFTNILLNTVVSIIFVLCLVSLLLSFISGGLLSFIYNWFFKFISVINNSSYSLIFGHLEWWMIFIYYVLFLWILLSIDRKNPKQFIKRFSLLLIGMTLLFYRNYFNPYESITFLNVYQGDCSIIIDDHNKCVMLVDTGGLKNYDIATKKIIPYLNYLGISRIDKVVITHDDYDHCGALESLCNNIPVKEIIRDNTMENIECGDIIFKNLNVGTYSNDNDSSIVLYGTVSNFDVLLMGDASSTIERKIIKEYEEFNVDILKVGHHGSSSSTCKEFVNYYKPKYSIISVGKNYYGHPTKDTLNNLSSSIIYRTDIDGTVKFSYNFFKKYYVETAKSSIISLGKEND